MLIPFKEQPPIGTVVHLDGQTFELIGEQPYQRKDGAVSKLLEWSTNCPDCGLSFSAFTGALSATFTRRCKDHRKAGKPVKGKRGRKVRVAIVEA